jgi:hypothetical protein
MSDGAHYEVAMALTCRVLAATLIVAGFWLLAPGPSYATYGHDRARSSSKVCNGNIRTYRNFNHCFARRRKAPYCSRICPIG